MDPEEALAELRRQAGRVLETGGTDPGAARALAFAATAVDDWMSRGGYRPGTWATTETR